MMSTMGMAEKVLLNTPHVLSALSPANSRYSRPRRWPLRASGRLLGLAAEGDLVAPWRCSCTCRTRVSRGPAGQAAPRGAPARASAPSRAATRLGRGRYDDSPQMPASAAPSSAAGAAPVAGASSAAGASAGTSTAAAAGRRRRPQTAAAGGSAGTPGVPRPPASASASTARSVPDDAPRVARPLGSTARRGARRGSTT